jgi:uncharacterized membrane protein YhaH (DUF805 family)
MEPTTQPVQPTTPAPQPQPNATTIPTKSAASSFFSRLFSGRINIKSNIIGSFIVVGLSILLFIIYTAITAVTNVANPEAQLQLPSIEDQAGGVVPTIAPTQTSPVVRGVNIFLIIFSLLEFLLSIIYSFSFGVRRLHDTNHSGLLSLLLFVPFVNLLLNLYLVFAPGTPGDNPYGPAPQKQTLKQVFGFA